MGTGKAIHRLAGRHVRLVWIQNQKRQTGDPYASGDSHWLMGLDSEDGLNARPLLQRPANYSRPFLAPDGRTVLFSRKTTIARADGKRDIASEIHGIDWMAKDDRTLSSGYAVAMWKEPRTGVCWVYALRDFEPATRPEFEGRQLVRFPIDQPRKVEVVWHGAPLSPDNIQLALDGSSACAAAPWPEVCRVRLDDLQPQRVVLGRGCWPSLAPDGSGLMWCFQEDHRRVLLFDAQNRSSGAIDLAASAGLAKGTVYHPRWSNNARFIVFTGPYNDAEGQPTTTAKGGLTAEVYLARLDPGRRRIEGVVRVTQNNLGDNYPDAWIDPAP